jgi:hypothetical protein
MTALRDLGGTRKAAQRPDRAAENSKGTAPREHTDQALEEIGPSMNEIIDLRRPEQSGENPPALGGDDLGPDHTMPCQ